MAINHGRTLTDDEKEQFAYELALGYFDDEELRMRFELSPQPFEKYKQSDEIKRMVLIRQREIDESDQAIRIHARRAARIAIKQMADLVGDEDAPAKTRMDASRQLREYATVVDKDAIGTGGEGPIYMKTNLELGTALQGVYAVTAKEVEDQMRDRPDDTFEGTDDEYTPEGVTADVNTNSDDVSNFADLLGLEGM